MSNGNADAITAYTPDLLSNFNLLQLRTPVLALRMPAVAFTHVRDGPLLAPISVEWPQAST